MQMKKMSSKASFGARAGLLVTSLCAAALAGQEVLKDHEVDKLATALGKALEKHGDTPGKERDKARAGLVEELEQVGKRLEAPKGSELERALMLTKELGAALARTGKYKALARGRIDSFKSPDGIEYSAWAPRTYDPKKQSYPVVLIVPGLEQGKPMRPETLLQQHWLDAGLRDQAILVVPSMPENTAAWSLASAPDDGPGGIAVIMQTLKEVRDNFAIDYDRCFLAGRELGVEAAMAVAMRFPHVFAGVIGRSGDIGDAPPDNFRNLPTLLSGGGAQATAFAEKAKAAGFDNCTLTANSTDAEVWTWMQAHSRQALPTEVTLVPGSPIPNSAYWIQVPPTDAKGNARVDAKADRETNTITITGGGVASVGVLLNDQLVDLSKPVKLVLNGAVQEHLIKRNLDVMLDMIFRGKSDPGRVYTAFMSFDLPAE
jgi:hypothetical protein